VNPAYEAVMGIRRENVIGKSFREVWPRTEQVWLDIIDEVVQTGGSVDHQGFSADIGKYLQALAFAINSEEVAVLFLDITPRVVAHKALERKEERLLKYRETLRRLATKLTLAEEKTRRQLANDLHDRIGYSLAMTLHKLHQAAEESKGHKSCAPVWEALSMIEGVIRDTRSLTFEISSPLLYEVGLEAALESLGEQLLSPHSISFDFSESGPEGELDPNVKVLLFQMARELLVNVIKHARAREVRLSVLREAEALSIVVEDDGIGFRSAIFRESPDGVFGLFSIRERLRHIGGIIQIGVSPTGGAKVTLWAPSKERERGKRS
jgi:signal transduction histidine kinase